MVVVMFVKNGKTWVNPLKQTKEADGVNVSEAQEVINCPFDNAELAMNYDCTQYSGAMTEIPEDLLPANFKKANMETFWIYQCPKCQKRFMAWFNGGESQEFHEVKLLPDGDYSREGEAGSNQPVIPENEAMYGVRPQSDKNCDCGGECDNHGCDNNKMNPNKFNRPDFYG